MAEDGLTIFRRAENSGLALVSESGGTAGGVGVGVFFPQKAGLVQEPTVEGDCHCRVGWAWWVAVGECRGWES